MIDSRLNYNNQNPVKAGFVEEVIGDIIVPEIIKRKKR